MRVSNPMFALASIGFFACGNGDHHEPACVGTAGAAETIGTVTGTPSELSGLAADGSLLWTFADSGNPAELHAVDAATAQHVATVQITNASNFDWEDIAIAPCSAGRCIYISDTGDNDLVRGNVVLYEVVPPTAPTGTTTATAVAFAQRYADGPHNLEALFADPRDSATYGISKETTGVATIFQFPRAGATNTPIVIGTLAIPTGDNRVTAADLAYDDVCGVRILVRTRTNVFIYYGDASATIAETLASEPDELTAPTEPQGEAIAWGPDGYFTISEGANPTLYSVSYAIPL